MSMNNLAGMMDEVLIALARCKQPTCKVPPARSGAATFEQNICIHLIGKGLHYVQWCMLQTPQHCGLLRQSRSIPVNLHWQVLLSMARRSWRQQTIDQLLFAPEEVPQEALERLHRCGAHCSVHWSAMPASKLSRILQHANEPPRIIQKHQVESRPSAPLAQPRRQLQALLCRRTRYQATRPDLQKVLHPMLPPGRAIFMRRMKNKITAKEKRARDKAARKAAARERKAERVALKKDRKAQVGTQISTLVAVCVTCFGMMQHREGLQGAGGSSPTT